MEVIITDYILPNGRKLIGTEEEVLAALEQEQKRLERELEILTPKVQKDLKESREKHRRLWNY